jgi:hypothetical protein
MQSHWSATETGAVRIVGNHGYRIEGDVALLNADLAVLSPDASRERWALQLWACARPHAGGPLAGTKVAEAKVDLSRAEPGDPQHLQASAPARLPPHRGGHAMVLVLASDRAGAFEDVHDFANYDERQEFYLPHFAGAAGYSVEGEEVIMRVDRISNPREPNNLSGSLSLELRANAEPRASAEQPDLVLARAPIGRLAGGAWLDASEWRVPFHAPPAGEWSVALELLEWTAAGPATRDRCVFAAPYRTPAPAEAPAPPEPALVSIQTATVDELARVQGLTRKLASEIVKARPFLSLADLLRVRGIGEKTARKLKGRLTL